MKNIILITLLTLILAWCGKTTETVVNTSTSTVNPYEIGTVDTAFKVIWPDHKIEVGAVPDPKVQW